ncbi:MAG: sigma 54-interacting transcriptional regulator [Candidatus Babeliales bacterium]
MFNILYFFETIINSFPFLLLITLISISFKTGLLIFIIIHGFFRSTSVKKPWIFLSIVIISAMFSDMAWIIFTIKKLFIPDFSYKLVSFFIRISWIWFIVEYQALSLFIESLINKDYKISIFQYFFIGIGILFSFLHLYLAIQNIFFASTISFKYSLYTISTIYNFFPIVFSLYFTLKKLKTTFLPKILHQQAKVFIKFLIAPHLISDFIQLYPFSFYPSYIASNYAVVSISTAALTFALYFSAKKVMGLRFLNFQNHVQSVSSFNFIDDFKNTLEQLGQVTNMKELNHIAQSFFKNMFSVHPNRIMLVMRKIKRKQEPDDTVDSLNPIEKTVEAFISHHENEGCSIANYLRQEKILIMDEIEFSNFYENSATSQEILPFLKQINVDIFLPIYEKNTIIGYIVVERDSRSEEFYSNIERDEMVVFASYLANIINLLENRNLVTIIQKEKELQEELYRKLHEINQYKESIRSFLRDNKQRKIGILFYKQRRFIYANQTAKDLLQVNINVQEGHPLTKSLYKLSQQVQEYKTSYTCLVKDTIGNRLVLSAIPNLEQNNIIILVYYPEISDIVKEQVDLLKNPSEWDYLLYLETTASGKLIKQLIPGSGEKLLNFKIELLKTALSKKALLLEIPEADIMPMVELLHHISLRETLHILKLQAPEKNFATAMKLFGMNSIFGLNRELALLEKLNEVGTLFIENIHFLDLETQHHLAEFIRYGFFHVFKGDHKITANVRIICSTNQNLSTLVQEGRFSRALFKELNQTTLIMPPLLSLPKKELTDLAEGFTEQAIQTQTFKNLLVLTEKEKLKLINSCPASLQEFRSRVQNILLKKSQKNEVLQEVQFDPAYNVSDPELVEAARLGKKALKDPKILRMLMQKFKNQNKIATFLGVNRSSINRRCKEYNID